MSRKDLSTQNNVLHHQAEEPVCDLSTPNEDTQSSLPPFPKSYDQELILKIEGRIEYEWCLNLKNHLLHIGHNHPDHLLHLDLSDLDFIGSSSILHFVEVMRSIYQAGIGLKLTNVQIEFIKVFQLYQLTEIPIYPPSSSKEGYPKLKKTNPKKNHHLSKEEPSS
jgi:anti-anti-sigma factor